MWFASPDHSEGFMARFGWCAAADHLKNAIVGPPRPLEYEYRGLTQHNTLSYKERL